MSLFKKLFSNYLRTARQAEAAGNMDVAAENYAMAGDADGAVRMHMARAARAPDRNAEIAALRDALRWAADDAGLQQMAGAALGRALWAAAKAEGIATERDRQRVQQAAAMLLVGKEYLRAGEALEQIGDYDGAAQAYSQGGLVDKLEAALAKDDAHDAKARALAQAMANYETNMQIGNRDRALAALRLAIENSDQPLRYRQLQNELQAKLITGSRVVLRLPNQQTVTVCGGARVVLGRDPLCEVVIATNGVSRQHAELVMARVDGDWRYTLADLGSRNGTSLGGLPLLASAAVTAPTTIGLGDESLFDVSREGGVLWLVGKKGKERGNRVAVIASAPSGASADADADAASLAAAGLPVRIKFVNGRPWLAPTDAAPVIFGQQALGDVFVQLIRGDGLVVGTTAVEVE